MRPFIQNTVSYLGRRIEAIGLTAADNSSDVVGSDYRFRLTKYQQAWPKEDCVRRRVGIFYADIADYSRLSELDEEGTHHRLVERMKIMQAHITEAGGRVVHFAGDAILAEFKDAENALNCAIDVQRWNHQKNTGLSSDKRILYRIGVNFGDVIADRGNIFGNAVILAARLEKLARSGGICVSESIWNRLKSHPAFDFIAMGKQYVKNVSEPVEVFWIEFDSEAIKQIDHSGVAKASVSTSRANNFGYRECRYSKRSSGFLKQVEFQGGFE